MSNRWRDGGEVQARPAAAAGGGGRDSVNDNLITWLHFSAEVFALLYSSHAGLTFFQTAAELDHSKFLVLTLMRSRSEQPDSSTV
jgi:hypothetical protein